MRARERRLARRAAWLSTLLLSSVAQAGLQDVETDNDALATAPVALDATSGFASDGGLLRLDASDVDFFPVVGLASGDIVTAVTTPRDDPHFEVPNTAIALVDDEGAVLAEGTFGTDNDDASGRGLGSLLRFAVPAPGDYAVVVTGIGDTQLVGEHFEEGRYLLSLIVHDASDDTPDGDDEPANDSRATAGGAPAFTAPGLQHAASRGALASGDVDFVALPGLLAGDVVTAVTTPFEAGDLDDPDTRLGLFGPAPEAAEGSDEVSLATGDDSLDSDAALQSLGSLLRVEVADDGDYWIGVTGAADGDFTGAHDEDGAYVVGVAVVTAPEPAGGLASAFALTSVASLRLRARRS